MSASAREQLVGPDSGPESPFPYQMEGKVISGFGRGSKELGIPTANLPVDKSLTPWIATAPSGVYFGWSSFQLPTSHADHKPFSPSSSSSSSTVTSTATATEGNSSSTFSLFPMVMSIGYNPFYKNTVRSAEVHILHKFSGDFYGSEMRLMILGFIREEKDYKSLEALVEDINIDCEVARRSVARPGWKPVGLEDGRLDGGWLVRDGQSVPAVSG